MFESNARGRSGPDWVEDNRRRGGKLKGAEQGNMSISGYDPVNPGKWRDAQTENPDPW